MISFPNCKINLGLNILRKRDDGYHDLETVFYPIALCDTLEVIKGNNKQNKQVVLITEGLPIGGDTGQNLIVKAYHLLNKKYGLDPVTFCLLKNIPMGAGLGGGSSNGAFAIGLLNRLFDLNLSGEEKKQLASELGSDCAFFIQNQACFGTGRGELLEPLDLSLQDYWIALVKPDIHISTREAFAGIQARTPEPENRLRKRISEPVHLWKNTLKNDFEDALFPAYPVLKQIKESLYEAGAVYAAMSGSGSSLFGLFRAEPNLKNQYPDCFYYEGKLA